MSSTVKPEPSTSPTGSGSGALMARWRPRAATATVWYLRLIALLNLVAVLSVPFRDQIRTHNEGEYFTPYMMTAGLSFAVISVFLAIAMRRRKRAAWIFNTALAYLFAVLYLLAMTLLDGFDRHPLNYISIVLTWGFLLALLIGRKEFTSKGDSSNPKTAAATFVLGLGLGGVIGAALVALTNKLPGAADFWDMFRYSVGRMISIDPSEHLRSVIVAPTWVNAVINVMGGVFLLLVFYVAFRSPRDTELLTAEDEQRIRGLLEKQGERDSLGYFALRRDKAVMFSPSGKAAVTYRVVGGVSLASGDPIGDPEAWPGAIDAWLTEAREHAWAPAS